MKVGICSAGCRKNYFSFAFRKSFNVSSAGSSPIVNADKDWLQPDQSTGADLSIARKRILRFSEALPLYKWRRCNRCRCLILNGQISLFLGSRRILRSETMPGLPELNGELVRRALCTLWILIIVHLLARYNVNGTREKGPRELEE